MIDLVAGDELAAPWGRYRFLRYDGSHAVLQDRANPSAFVVPHVEQMAEYSIMRRAAELGREGHQCHARRQQPSPPPARSCDGASRPSPPSETPSASCAATSTTSSPAATTPSTDSNLPSRPSAGTPERHGRIGTATTLGALQPSRGYISLPGVELLYWAPCFTRAPEGGEPHAWFITSNQTPRFRCPSCSAAAPREQTPANLNEAPPPVNTPAPADDLKAELGDFSCAPWGAAQPLWAKPGEEHLEEVWRERAAIREYLAGEPRGRAEALAYYELVRTWGQAA